MNCFNCAGIEHIVLPVLINKRCPFFCATKSASIALFGISFVFHLISFRQYQKIMPLFSYVTSDFPFIFCINCITLFSKSLL